MEVSVVDTQAWVRSVTGESVVDAAPLVGGMSSVVSLLELSSGARVVLRHVDDADWLDREPGLLAREARALELLETDGLRTPRLIALGADHGLLLMTWMPGRMVVDAAGLVDRLASIAQVAASVSAVALPPDHGLPPWTSWVADDPSPPSWGDRALWSQAIERHRAGPSTAAEPSPVLLHRDLHPLNMLWDGGEVSVVDWVNACVGPRDAELAHLRWNLAVLAGIEAAEAMTRHYLDAVGVDEYDTWWDLATVLSFLPGPIGRSGWESVGLRLTDEHVVRATQDLITAAMRSS